MGNIDYSDGDGLNPTMVSQPRIVFPFKDNGNADAIQLHVDLVWENPAIWTKMAIDKRLLNFPFILSQWREWISGTESLDTAYFNKFENFYLCEITDATPSGAGQYLFTAIFANIPGEFDELTEFSWDEPRWTLVPLNSSVPNGGGGKTRRFIGRMHYKFFYNSGAQEIVLDEAFSVYNYTPRQPYTAEYVRRYMPEGEDLLAWDDPRTTPEQKSQLIQKYPIYSKWREWLANREWSQASVIDASSTPNAQTYSSWLHSRKEIVPFVPTLERYCGKIFVIKTPYIKLSFDPNNIGTDVELPASPIEPFGNDAIYVNFWDKLYYSTLEQPWTQGKFYPVQWNNPAIGGNKSIGALLKTRDAGVAGCIRPIPIMNDAIKKCLLTEDGSGATLIFNMWTGGANPGNGDVYFAIGRSYPELQLTWRNSENGAKFLVWNQADVSTSYIPMVNSKPLLFVFHVHPQSGYNLYVIDPTSQKSSSSFIPEPFSFHEDGANVYVGWAQGSRGVFATMNFTEFACCPTLVDVDFLASEWRANGTLKHLFKQPWLQ